MAIEPTTATHEISVGSLPCRDIAPEQQRVLSFDRLLSFLKRDVLRYSPYYRKRFTKIGLNPDAIRSEGDYATKVPFTYKDDLREFKADFVLQPTWTGVTGSLGTEEISSDYLTRYRQQAQAAAATASDVEPLASIEERVRREFLKDWQPILTTRTGGSTGVSAESAYTATDLDGPFKRAGLFHHNIVSWTPTQRFMSLIPAGEHLGFYGNLLVPLLNAQPLRPMFGGRVISTESQILTAHRTRVQAIFATSSYAVNWLTTACKMMETGQIDGLPELQLVSVSAEALSEGYAQTIRGCLQKLGADRARLVQGLSSTELKSGGFRECDSGTGLHIDPQHYFVELIDPDTKKPVPAGQPGVLVWSHIDWHGSVILRYWSGDVIEGGLRFDRCSKCGLVVPRMFFPIRRLESDFIKVRAARVDLVELRAALETLLPRDTYQIEIRSNEAGRQEITAFIQDDIGVAAKDIGGLVMRTVELKVDTITFCNADDMQRKLYGTGGWKPRWLIND
jgi:phenylacetate-CoA ligase